MNRRKINRLVYTGALLVLFVIGVILWYQQVGSSEMKVFTVIHQKEASFDFKSKFKKPERLKISFEGKVDCDALLVVKNTGQSVKSILTFPIKKGDLKEKVLDCPWTSPGVLLQIRSNECEINDLKIILEVLE